MTGLARQSSNGNTLRVRSPVLEPAAGRCSDVRFRLLCLTIICSVMQAFCSYISIGNNSAETVTNIGIKVGLLILYAYSLPAGAACFPLTALHHQCN